MECKQDRITKRRGEKREEEKGKSCSEGRCSQKTFGSHGRLEKPAFTVVK